MFIMSCIAAVVGGGLSFFVFVGLMNFLFGGEVFSNILDI